LKDEVLTSQR